MKNRICIAVSLGLVCGLAATSGQAAELSAGTVISAANYEQVRSDTFEGRTIESMLPDTMQWMIKTHGMKFSLQASNEFEMDEKYVEATRRNVDQVTYDPVTRAVVGWESGMPFPDVALDDPHGGDKVAWNQILGTTYGSTFIVATRYLFIDMKKGLERNQLFDAVTTRSIGLLEGGPTSSGDGEFLRRIIYAKYPNDIKGIGTFSVRYTDFTKPEDTWAYLKSVRRTRRLSGNAWMDPIAGGDQLNDDFDGWDAEPPKYQEIKLTGKRWMLVAANQPSGFTLSPGDTEVNGVVNIKDAPYSMPGEGWQMQPREVYVFEGTAPERHPYSKKVIYIDAKYPGVYFGEFYDKQGELWKTYLTARQPSVGETTGFKGAIPVVGFINDYKRNHATIWISNTVSDPKGWDKTTNTLQRLQQMAQ